MTTFHLTVVTPDGCAFEGQAERIVCRAIDGDIAILAKHGDYCTALGMGEAHIVDADGQRRRAACMGGLLSVLDGDVRLVATTWEWAEDIDQARAEASKKRAEEILARKNLNDREYELAQARLKRALGRTSVRYTLYAKRHPQPDGCGCFLFCDGQLGIRSAGEVTTCRQRAGTLRWARGREGCSDSPLPTSGLHPPRNGPRAARP